MESLILIYHKWHQGVYSLEDMINLVDSGKITKEDFFDITRYNYDGIIKSNNLKE